MRELSREVTVLAHLQASSWDSWHYVNLGFWLSHLGKTVSSRVSAWHIHARIEDVVDIDRDALVGALDGASAIAIEDRKEVLRMLLTSPLKHLFHVCASESELAEYLSNPVRRAVAIQPEARARLGVPVAPPGQRG